MKKPRWLTMGIVAGSIVAGSIFAAAPAYAGWPTNCSYWVSDNAAYALCDGGTGAYQATGVCKINGTNSIAGNLYGPWVTPGHISKTAKCQTFLYMAYAGIVSKGTP